MTSAQLQPFQAMEILTAAKRLEAQGRHICHLELGEPGAPPAPKVLEAVRAALPQGQPYTAAKGLIGLREGLCRYYADRHQVAVDPESIIVTMGSSAAFILSFLAAFAPGARIAITRPGYPAYLNTLVGLGYEAVEIPLSAQNGWRLRADDIAAAHARTPFAGLLFASPANPTGASVGRAEMADIAATCARLGVTLISDEIYHGLDFEGPSASALEVSDQALIVNSFSKYYCMTGWRIGWMVVPEALVRRAEMLQQNLFISAPTLSQVAAEAALGETEYAETQKAVYARNRVLLHQGLAGLGFTTAGLGDGAFYAYADASRFTNDSLKFCQTLLHEAGVAATPGVDFDRVDGGKFVRFSYAGSAQTIEKALERMGTMLG